MKSSCIIAMAIAVAAQGGMAFAQTAAPAKPMLTLQMPALPDPVKVTLKAATTAVLVSDMIDPTCKVQPKCTGTMVPAIAALLAQARKAGIMVVYSTRDSTMTKWLPEVAPVQGDPLVPSRGQDRFYETDLDKILKAKGITNVVMTGWKISGSILYSSIGATLRGYTVIIPQDASLAAVDYEMAIGLYQILNQNSANATNEPLKPNATTLSRSDMITFQ